jgi:hypothetical protein
LFPQKKVDAYKVFDEKFNIKQKSMDFYNMKMTRSKSLTKEDLELAYNFLSELDAKIHGDYISNNFQ